MNVLIVCKLANHTLKENVLLPLLSSEIVDNIYVIRDFPADSIERVHYICPPKWIKGHLRHLWKIPKGIISCYKYSIGNIIGILNLPHGYIGRMISFLAFKPYTHMTIAGHREYWMNGPKWEKRNIKIFGGGNAITVSGTITKNYLISKGISPEMIFVLPNLPNEDYRQINLREQRFYDIVSLSRIDKNKNLILLIKSLKKLKEKGLTPRVAIAGDGDCLNSIIKASKDYGVYDQIDFLGYISEFDKKVKILTNSEIFISCSKGEGFPVSMLEAMHCGCVPVVSNVGDIADLIRNCENGYMFNDTDDEVELTNILLHILPNKSKIKELRLYSLNDVKKISVSNNGKIWTKILSYKK